MCKFSFVNLSGFIMFLTIKAYEFVLDHVFLLIFHIGLFLSSFLFFGFLREGGFPHFHSRISREVREKQMAADFVIVSAISSQRSFSTVVQPVGHLESWQSLEKWGLKGRY